MIVWYWVVTVELVVATVVGAMFAVRYALRSPWRHTPTGRQLLAAISVTVLESASLGALALGIPVPVWLFAIGFGLLDAVLIRWWMLLRRAQEVEE